MLIFRIIISIFVILIASILVFVVLQYDVNLSGGNLVFSEKSMLQALWENYKEEYLDESTGRAVDRQQGEITTSEGQSYSLLRAVWMDDQATFDRVFDWTRENMQHKNDNLFSWLYGKKADGQYGILTDRGGNNSATDADTDIALALIFAYSRWGNEAYLESARLTINDIWEKEIVTVKGIPYMTANDVEKFYSSKVLINPSYLAPYAYRIFAKVDEKHNWLAVVDSSYEILEKTASSPLDKWKSAGLPPDWVILNRNNQTIEPVGTNLTTDFGFDALRTVWRVALDYEWFGEPRAKNYLDKLTFLSEEWWRKGYISSRYSHDGSVVTESEASAMYGGVIGYFKTSDKANAPTVYVYKLRSLFNQDNNSFKDYLSYYDSNWVWFGMGLYSGLLPNLSIL